MKRHLSIALGMLLLALAVLVYAREWTDGTGQFKIEAEFVAVSGDKVRLKKPDGSLVEVPLERLSDSDRRFVEAQRASKATDPFVPVKGPSAPIQFEPAATVIVVAEGVGTTRQEAVSDAGRNAARQVLGAMLDADTLVREDKVIDENVLAKSDGIIGSGCELFEEKEAGGLVRVKIKANIQRDALVVRLNANNIAMRTIDGKSLAAEASDKLESNARASDLLQKALATYPAEILIAEVKGKPTIAHENNGNIAMKFELTVQGDMDKYDQWQKRAIPLLEQLATKSGEKFVKASVIQDSYLTTALSNVLVNEYSDDAGKRRILSDPAFIRSCVAFRRFEAPGVGLGVFNDDGQDRVTFVVNTGRNKLQDRTTWRWFSLPLTCPERRIRVEVMFLDKSGGEVVKDVLQFEGRGCTCPGRLLMYKCSGGICEIDGAVLSPYWLVFTSAYPQSVSYAPSLTLTRSIDITPGEFESIATTRCVIKPL
jgi:hypothetical protein